MSKFCKRCFKPIEGAWFEMQESLNQIKGRSIKDDAFLTRCIYCYYEFVRMLEEDEHKYYINIKDAIEKKK